MVNLAQSRAVVVAAWRRLANAIARLTSPTIDEPLPPKLTLVRRSEDESVFQPRGR